MKTKLISLLLVFGASGAQILQNNGEDCRLLTFIPFTDERDPIDEAHANEGVDYYGYGEYPNAETLAKASFSLLATAEIAREHFNERNPIIVPELADLDCDVQLPENGWYIDSAHDRQTTITSFLNLQTEALLNGDDPAESVCAIVGPVQAPSHAALATVTESIAIPQLVYGTVDRRLNNHANFPYIARLIPEAVDVAEAIAKYIQRDVFKRDYLAIIYHSSDFGEQFEDPLEDAEDSLGYETITESFNEGDDESMEDSLREARDKGYRTIFVVSDRLAVLDDIARIADGLGMLGEGYLWILNGDALNPAQLPLANYPVDSSTDRLLRGAIMISHLDSYHYEETPMENKFIKMWKSQNPSIIPALNSRVPFMPGTNTTFYAASEDYFLSEMPTWYSTYMYDSIIAAGMSACKAKATGSNHHESLLHTNFTGASGEVTFRPNDEDIGKRTARNKEAGKFGAHNIRPSTISDGMQYYEAPLTAIFSYEDNEEGAWKKTENEFIFFDQTTNEPQPLRTVSDFHYLSKTIQRLGLSLAGISLSIACLSAIWVFFRRNDTLVKAAQPEFLYLLCFGSMLVASSLIFISFDEDKNWTEDQLDRGCSVFSWLFSLGYLTMYCALFSKLWRLSKLLQMRRRRIAIKQVLIPFSIVISACLIILIAMQSTDPVEWERTIISGSDTSDEPLETYGECNLSTKLEYIVPLHVLFVVVVCMTAVIGWKCRHIQEDLSDAKWVFAAIFCHLQFWLIGTPIVEITSGISRDANYLMIASLIFAFSTSMIVLIIGPKQWLWVRETYFKSPSTRSEISINVSGSPATHVSGIDMSNLQEQSLALSRSMKSLRDDRRPSSVPTTATGSSVRNSGNSHIGHLPQGMQSSSSSLKVNETRAQTPNTAHKQSSAGKENEEKKKENTN